MNMAAGEPKPLVEPWLRRLLQTLVAVGFALVAANFCARWWYFEIRAPHWHLDFPRSELLSARLALLLAGATLAGAFALCDLLGSLPRIRRRALGSLLVAALLCGASFAGAWWLGRG
jgi:hypothetical protein